MESRETISKGALEKSMLEKKRVVVRVWTGLGNVHKPGNNFGHISVEAEGRYMSLWPEQAKFAQTAEGENIEIKPAAKGSEGLGVKSPVSHEFVDSYKAEVEKYECREPEFTVCFYTLEADKIKSKFHDKKGTIKGWCLFGGHGDDIDNCATFVWKLLKAGGIKNLVSKSMQVSVAATETSWGIASIFSGFMKSAPRKASIGSSHALENLVNLKIKNPDGLKALLETAKMQEWKEEPLTKEIVFKGEWLPSVAAKNAAGSPSPKRTGK